MADFWTQAAFALDLGTPEACDTFLSLAALLDVHDPDEPLPDELRAVLGDELDLGPLAETAGDGATTAFVSAGTHFAPELLVRVLQHLMCTHGIEGPFGFEWALTCSKPRLDGFGGGAVLIWPDRVRWLSTARWLDELGGEALTVSCISPRGCAESRP